MAQYELDILDYWMILKKRKYLIVLATLLVLGFTFTFTQFMKPTPVYEASARVKFDRSTTVAQQLLESITFATANDLTTQTEVIKGFPVMERVAQALAVVEADLPSEERRSAEYLNAVYNLGRQIQTSRESDTNIIRITATASEPDLAERMANEVAQAYNTRRLSFPTVLFANMMGFGEKAYFKAQAGAERAPTVDFGSSPAPAASPAQ